HVTGVQTCALPICVHTANRRAPAVRQHPPGPPDRSPNHVTKGKRPMLIIPTIPTAVIPSPVVAACSCAGCSTCGGGGTVPGGRTCPACGGSGRCSHGGGR